MKPDPNNPSEMIPGKRVSYDLQEIDDRDFDFDNPDHIKRINVWRRQILGRNFDKQRKTRQFWLELEKEYVVHLARAQLSSSSRIKWNRLANAFNERFQGTTQCTGEKLLSQGRQNFSGLQVERKAPWRTAAAIQGMSVKWGDFRELVREAEDREDGGHSIAMEDADGDVESRETEDELDDVEIPDPNPNPEPGVTPRKYKPYGKKSKGKVQSTKVETQDEEESESEDGNEMLL